MSQQREVPQFIDIEDKIAFQLTAKQLGWIALGCFFIFIAWVMLEKAFFIVTTVIVIIFILALIFIKPYGQTLPVFLKNVFMFTFKPKIYIWRRGYQNNPVGDKKKKPKAVVKKTNKKKLSPAEIKNAVQSLDIYE